MAAHGARRLLPMAENLAQILGIELLAAARAATSTRRCTRASRLERVRRLVRGRVPHLDDDRYLAPDIAAAADLVRSARWSTRPAWLPEAGRAGAREPVIAGTSQPCAAGA